MIIYIVTLFFSNFWSVILTSNTSCFAWKLVLIEWKQGRNLKKHDFIQLQKLSPLYCQRRMGEDRKKFKAWWDQWNLLYISYIFLLVSSSLNFFSIYFQSNIFSFYFIFHLFYYYLFIYILTIFFSTNTLICFPISQFCLRGVF